MNILILGATGFIGRNLTEKFAQNSEFLVSAVSHKTPPFSQEGVRWVQADLREIQQVANLFDGIDVVIQAAATTSGAEDIVNTPEIHVTDNAVMNSLILREISRSNVKHFIFFSCTTMYQSSAESRQSESAFDQNIPFYPKYQGVASTKVYIENLCQFYSKISNTKFTVIRHTNVYGPHDKFDLKRSHVMGATITKVMDARDKIEIWGNGSELRDLLFIEDLIELVELALIKQKDDFLLINAGADTGISVSELVVKVCQVAGKKLEFVYLHDKPTLNFSFIADSSTAFNALGWKAQTSLENGIRKTIDWWKSNIYKEEDV
jgi:GDP-L-fucose synthase